MQPRWPAECYTHCNECKMNAASEWADSGYVGETPFSNYTERITGLTWKSVRHEETCKQLVLTKESPLVVKK